MAAFPYQMVGRAAGAIGGHCAPIFKLRRMPLHEIETAGVVGAGTMGAGIAMSFANAGISVRLIDASPEALERAGTLIAANYASQVQRGKLTQAEADEKTRAIVRAAAGRIRTAPRSASASSRCRAKAARWKPLCVKSRFNMLSVQRWP